MLLFSLFERSQEMLFCLSTGKVQLTRKQKENYAYKALQTQIKHQLGFDNRNIGNMDTKSIFHKFSTITAKDILASLIDDESAWEPFKEVHFHLRKFFRALNSQHEQINVTLYKELCSFLYKIQMGGDIP